MNEITNNETLNAENILCLDEIKSAVESLIFISNKPLMIDDIKKLFQDLQTPKIRETFEALKNELDTQRRGMRIVEIAGGYQMVTAPENANHIKKFYKIKHTEKLSAPSLETLAIIAYKQPLTRIDIEALRGVNVDGVIRSLLEKNLIKIVGRKEVIGRPFVYGTTRLFLDYFGLKSLNELPKIEEFAQQDYAKDIELEDEDAQISPLTDEETQNLQAQAPVKEEENGNQHNPQ